MFRSVVVCRGIIKKRTGNIKKQTGNNVNRDENVASAVRRSARIATADAGTWPRSHAVCLPDEIHIRLAIRYEQEKHNIYNSE